MNDAGAEKRVRRYRKEKGKEVGEFGNKSDKEAVR